MPLFPLHPVKRPAPGFISLILAGSLLAGVAGLIPAARAGSATASSIWNKTNALDRARQQLPPGAVVTAEHCQEVEVGMGNIRYLCTVEFSPAPLAPIPTQAP